MSIDDLIKVLQASIAPCVLISGLALLLLSMTNRLARPIDRIRLLSGELRRIPKEEGTSLREQIKILYKRCHLLQTSITFTMVSILLVSVIILILFSTYIFNIHLESLVEIFFMGSLICLIAAVVYFIWDIRFSLRSVKIEIDKHFS